MKKRLFFAFPLTPGLYPKIANLEREIDKEIKVNWIPIKNLHLTLLFLGLADINEVNRIIEIFREVVYENIDIFRILKMKIAKIEYGPPLKKRMIWLYLEKNKQLEEMKKILENALTKNKIDFKKDERELIPHINLARLKFGKKFPEIKRELNWGIFLNKINLFESYLEKPFARYEVLFSTKLFSSS